MRRGIGAMIKSPPQCSRTLTISHLALSRPLVETSSGHSPQIAHHSSVTQTCKHLLSTDWRALPSILIFLVNTAPLHDNLHSALARFSHWWDFSTSIAKLRLHVPKQWRRNIDCCFLFTLERNHLAAYAVSESGVQLSAVADIGSSVQGTKLHTRSEYVR